MDEDVQQALHNIIELRSMEEYFKINNFPNNFLEA
jgi:hypothetical protein